MSPLCAPYGACTAYRHDAHRGQFFRDLNLSVCLNCFSVFAERETLPSGLAAALPAALMLVMLALAIAAVAFALASVPLVVITAVWWFMQVQDQGSGRSTTPAQSDEPPALLSTIHKSRKQLSAQPEPPPLPSPPVAVVVPDPIAATTAVTATTAVSTATTTAASAATILTSTAAATVDVAASGVDVDAAAAAAVAEAADAADLLIVHAGQRDYIMDGCDNAGRMVAERIAARVAAATAGARSIAVVDVADFCCGGSSSHDADGHDGSPAATAAAAVAAATLIRRLLGTGGSRRAACFVVESAVCSEEPSDDLRKFRRLLNALAETRGEAAPLAGLRHAVVAVSRSVAPEGNQWCGPHVGGRAGASFDALVAALAGGDSCRRLAPRCDTEIEHNGPGVVDRWSTEVLAPALSGKPPTPPRILSLSSSHTALLCRHLDARRLLVGCDAFYVDEYDGSNGDAGGNGGSSNGDRGSSIGDTNGSGDGAAITVLRPLAAAVVATRKKNAAQIPRVSPWSPNLTRVAELRPTLIICAYDASVGSGVA